MRAVLLLLFGGLVFLLTLVLTQALLDLDTAQMRRFFIPLLGTQPGERYTPGFTAKDMLAYLIAALVTGAVVYKFSRLLYRHST